MRTANSVCSRFVLPAMTVFIFFVLCVPAQSQEIRIHSQPSTSQPTAIEEPYSYPKIILAMGLVVGLILLLKWGTTKVAPGISAKSGKAMSVLSRLPIGPKQQLILIKVGRRAVLVGHAGAQMNPLCEITDADELAHLVGQSETEKSNPALGGFASLFKRREREFEPTPREIAQVSEPEEDEQLAQLARSELLGLSERVRGLSKEMNI
jgi:flagellar biogenesis protein FliO